MTNEDVLNEYAQRVINAAREFDAREIDIQQYSKKLASATDWALSYFNNR